jgi:hypothetical protein
VAEFLIAGLAGSAGLVSVHCQGPDAVQVAGLLGWRLISRIVGRWQRETNWATYSIYWGRTEARMAAASEGAALHGKQ